MPTRNPKEASVTGSEWEGGESEKMKWEIHLGGVSRSGRAALQAMVKMESLIPNAMGHHWKGLSRGMAGFDLGLSKTALAAV